MGVAATNDRFYGTRLVGPFLDLHLATVYGAGTSSATPQVAAAVALWLQKHATAPGPQPWRRVEAVRNAVFSSADKNVGSHEAKLGQGYLRAHAALDVAPDSTLPETPADAVWFPWIRMLLHLEAAARADERQEMLELEALQLYLTSRELQDVARNADPDVDELGPADRKRLLAAISVDPRASATLRGWAEQLMRKLPRVPTDPPGRHATPRRGGRGS